MKILSDFDGVLTNLNHEAARVREIFRRDFAALTGSSASETQSLLEEVEEEMDRVPHLHGWRVLNRVTAFCNEDGFIRANAVGACLDDWADQKRTDIVALRAKLKDAGKIDFKALSQSAYEQMVAETAAGKQHPIDESTRPVLQRLLDKGVDIVVVSNSGTDRIVQLLSNAGLSPVAHGKGEGTLRVRGNARKFILGEAPRTFKVGNYQVDTHRPDYEKIIREEKPDLVIGDVFSLDLALPLQMAAAREKGFENLQVVLRKREYSPDWSLEHLTKGLGREVKGGIFDRLDQLLELA